MAPLGSKTFVLGVLGFQDLDDANDMTVQKNVSVLRRDIRRARAALEKIETPKPSAAENTDDR